MQRHYTVVFQSESGVAQALKEYCEENGISVNSFIEQTVAEKLRNLDVRSMSIAEIERIENDGGAYPDQFQDI